MKPHESGTRVALTNPRRETVIIGGGKVQIFYPQTNEAQEVDLGRNRGVVDQFMLLGFGSNSTELKNAYSVAFGGVDSVNEQKATRIELVPKDPEILARVKKSELWISDKGWVVQQKLYTGGGGFLLPPYSPTEWYPRFAASAF